jgi:sec-independent protein translocase protein TatA
MAVIAAIGLLVFGPKRLPELGKTLGRTLRGFQSASKGFEEEFRRAVDTVEAEVSSASPAAIAATPPAPAAADPAPDAGTAAVSTEPADHQAAG